MERAPQASSPNDCRSQHPTTSPRPARVRFVAPTTSWRSRTSRSRSSGGSSSPCSRDGRRRWLASSRAPASSSRAGRQRAQAARCGAAPHHVRVVGRRPDRRTAQLGPERCAAARGRGPALERFCARHDPKAARLRIMRDRSRAWPDRPLISVLLPTYEPDAAYLRAAIESVIAQAYEHWELCIVDDGSPSTVAADVVAAFAGDPRVRFTAHAKNGGIAASSQRRRGIWRPAIASPCSITMTCSVRTPSSRWFGICASHPQVRFRLLG